MPWINNAAQATYLITAGQTLEGFQPLDFFHFYPLWYDVWVKRNVEALIKLDGFDKPYSELKELLPPPSNLRALIQKLVPSYLNFSKKEAGNFKQYGNFIARMLMEACPTDPFGQQSTPLHTPKEIETIIYRAAWEQGSTQLARLNGQLITAAGSLVHGLYNDVVTDFGWDTYGPYEKVIFNNQEYTLLIRDFPYLQPQELWEPELLASVSNIKMYQLYSGVQWKINCVGCHTTLINGNPMDGLKFFSIVADGIPLSPEDVKKLVDELSTKAAHIYQRIRRMNFEELKKLVMLQECFQLKKLYDAGGMDWRPTPDMYDRIKDRPLLTGLIPHGIFISELEEYKRIFGYDKFAREVLGEKV